MTKLLTSEEIARKLKSLSFEWSAIGELQLERDLKFKDFSSAVAFITKVAKVADKINHHPDIALSYGKVHISITTHSENGLTAADFHLAKEIEVLV